MKRYITPLIIALFTFLISFILLHQYMVKPSKIIFEIDAIVPVDDILQLFYLEDDMMYFTAEKQIDVDVTGSNKYQKIRFNIATGKKITKIRFDVSYKNKQKEIIIKDIKLKALNKTFKYNIYDDFTPNIYVKCNKEKIHTLTIDNVYDPFFTSNFDVEKTIETLNKEQAVLSNNIIILLSFILSVSIFFASYYKGFQLKSLNHNSYIIIFILILITPVFVKQFNLDVNTNVTEKRKLFSKPEFKLTKDYPQKFEKYYNDNFGLRSLLVNLNSKMKLYSLKISPKPESVLFGKNGFMFNNSGDAYTSYSHQNIISKQDLEMVYQKHNSIKNTLASKNIKYIIGFFPNKHTVYNNLLPFYMKMQIIKDTSLADQLVSYFKSKNFPFIDVRKELIAAKKENQLYYKFDTHWNSYGAYIAYKAFCNKTFNTLNITPYDTSDFYINYSQSRNGDLVNMIGIDTIKSYYDEVPHFVLKQKSKDYEEININNDKSLHRTIVTINKNCDNKSTVLIFRDSYTDALIPFFSLHFHKVIYVWTKFEGDKAQVDMSIVEQNKPDIVMLLYVERYLHLF